MGRNRKGCGTEWSGVESGRERAAACRAMWGCGGTDMIRRFDILL